MASDMEVQAKKSSTPLGCFVQNVLSKQQNGSWNASSDLLQNTYLTLGCLFLCFDLCLEEICQEVRLF